MARKLFKGKIHRVGDELYWGRVLVADMLVKGTAFGLSQHPSSDFKNAPLTVS